MVKQPMVFAEPEMIPSTSGADQFSLKFICMFHIHRIMKLSSVEMRGGYWEERMPKDKSSNIPLLVYVQDSREQYSNAVDALADLLYYRFDDKIKPVFEEVEDAIEQLVKETKKKTSIDEDTILTPEYYKDNTDKQIVEEYKIIKFQIHRRLFRELCNFLHRINWMERMGRVE